MLTDAITAQVEHYLVMAEPGMKKNLDAATILDIVRFGLQNGTFDLGAISGKDTGHTTSTGSSEDELRNKLIALSQPESTNR